MAVKKSFNEINTALRNYPEDTTVAQLLADQAFTNLMEAKKGGFTGVDSYIDNAEGIHIARICAMTHAVYAHDNSDKTKSFFYKNGSYMIGAEVVKANARKEWELNKEQAEADLEEEMLEGTISPKEWKEQRTALQKEEFSFTLDPTVKQTLIDTFDGTIVLDADGNPDAEASKAEWLANQDSHKPFSDYAEEIAELRAEAPQREETEED